MALKGGDRQLCILVQIFYCCNKKYKKLLEEWGDRQRRVDIHGEGADNLQYYPETVNSEHVSYIGINTWDQQLYLPENP